MPNQPDAEAAEIRSKNGKITRAISDIDQSKKKTGINFLHITKQPFQALSQLKLEKAVNSREELLEKRTLSTEVDKVN